MDRKTPLEELRCLGQSSNFEIKQEPDDAEFNIEDLHHSIDIKEEIPFVDPEEIKCECYLCGIQFCDKSQLIEHLETQCLEKPLSCEICAFRCLTKLQLSRHMKTHIVMWRKAETATQRRRRLQKEKEKRLLKKLQESPASRASRLQKRRRKDAERRRDESTTSRASRLVRQRRANEERRRKELSTSCASRLAQQSRADEESRLFF